MKKYLSKSIIKENLYLFAILSIAVIITANQFVIQQLLFEKKTDATLINLSGQQRMLSQRIVSFAYQAKNDPVNLYKLKAEVQIWDRIHKGLQEGDELYKLPVLNNSEIEALFAKANIYQEQMVKLVDNIETSVELENKLPEIVEVSEAFLPIMDNIVLQFQIQSEKKVQNLIWLEIILASLSLLILLLEIKFIFKPVISDISKKGKKFEKLNASKDRIISTLVHDLRNPLTGIRGFSGLLEEQLDDQLTDDQKMMFNLIDQSCEKSDKMIQELLDIAITESKEFHLEMEKTRIGEYLISTLSHFKIRAKEKGVDLQLEEKDGVLLASIDQERFARVIDNLMSNALKFTDSQGKVKVETFKDEDQVVIKVEDTGIGIPEHMQDFIFDKFSKARRLGLEGEKTTGLGMSIAKQIVDMHEGEIWIESEENKGTSIYISLPTAA